MRIPLRKEDSTGDQQRYEDMICVLRKFPFATNNVIGVEATDAPGYYDFPDEDIELDVPYQRWVGTTLANVVYDPTWSDENGEVLKNVAYGALMNAEDFEDGEIIKVEGEVGEKVFVGVPISDIEGFSEIIFNIQQPTSASNNAPVVTLLKNSSAHAIGAATRGDVGFSIIPITPSITTYEKEVVYHSKRGFYDDWNIVYTELGKIFVAFQSEEIHVFTFNNAGEFSDNILADAALVEEPDTYVNLEPFTIAIRLFSPDQTPSLPTPVNVLPANHATDVDGLSVFFDWTDSAGAATYDLVVDTDSSFANPRFLEINDLAISQAQADDFSEAATGTTYYWKVIARNGALFSAYSATFDFQIA